MSEARSRAARTLTGTEKLLEGKLERQGTALSGAQASKVLFGISASEVPSVHGPPAYARNLAGIDAAASAVSGALAGHHRPELPKLAASLNIARSINGADPRSLRDVTSTHRGISALLDCMRSSLRAVAERGSTTARAAASAGLHDRSPGLAHRFERP